MTGGLFCLVFALSNAETHSWSAPLTVIMLIAAALLLVGFVVIESRVAAPLLPLRILIDRNRAGSYLAILFAFCGVFGAFLFLTYYLQQGLGFSPLKTGLAFLPITAGIALAAGTSNILLIPRFGARPIMPTGMLIAAGAMLWLTRLSTASTYLGNVIGPMFLLGLGVGYAFAPAIHTATIGLHSNDAGVGSAMVSASQQIGGAIGIASLSTIFSGAVSRYLASHQPPSPAVQAGAAIHGYTVAFTVSCGLFCLGAALTGLLLRSGQPTSAQDTRAA